MPTETKPMPAITASVFSLINSDTTEPATTPMADVATNAVEAAKKIIHLLTSLSDANNIVASCVLSPNSAIKTAANTIPKYFQSN